MTSEEAIVILVDLNRNFTYCVIERRWYKFMPISNSNELLTEYQIEVRWGDDKILTTEVSPDLTLLVPDTIELTTKAIAQDPKLWQHKKIANH